MLQELVIDWAKLEALSIDDLVCIVGVDLIDDIWFLLFGSELAPDLMGCDD